MGFARWPAGGIEQSAGASSASAARRHGDRAYLRVRGPVRVRVLARGVARRRSRSAEGVSVSVTFRLALLAPGACALPHLAARLGEPALEAWLSALALFHTLLRLFLSLEPRRRRTTTRELAIALLLSYTPFFASSPLSPTALPSILPSARGRPFSIVGHLLPVETHVRYSGRARVDSRQQESSAFLCRPTEHTATPGALEAATEREHQVKDRSALNVVLGRLLVVGHLLACGCEVGAAKG